MGTSAQRLPRSEGTGPVHVRRVRAIGGPRKQFIAEIPTGVVELLRTADVVHHHDPRFVFELAVATRRIIGKPLLVHTHGLILHTGDLRRIKGTLLRFYYGPVFRHLVTGVVADSSSDRLMLRQACRVPDDRIHLFLNALDLRPSGASRAIHNPAGLPGLRQDRLPQGACRPASRARDGRRSMGTRRRRRRLRVAGVGASGTCGRARHRGARPLAGPGRRRRSWVRCSAEHGWSASRANSRASDSRSWKPWRQVASARPATCPPTGRILGEELAGQVVDFADPTVSERLRGRDPPAPQHRDVPGASRPNPLGAFLDRPPRRGIRGVLPRAPALIPGPDADSLASVDRRLTRNATGRCWPPGRDPRIRTGDPGRHRSAADARGARSVAVRASGPRVPARVGRHRSDVLRDPQIGTSDYRRFDVRLDHAAVAAVARGGVARGGRPDARLGRPVTGRDPGDRDHGCDLARGQPQRDYILQGREDFRLVAAIRITSPLVGAGAAVAGIFLTGSLPLAAGAMLLAAVLATLITDRAVARTGDLGAACRSRWRSRSCEERRRSSGPASPSWSSSMQTRSSSSSSGAIASWVSTPRRTR